MKISDIEGIVPVYAEELASRVPETLFGRLKQVHVVQQPANKMLSAGRVKIEQAAKMPPVVTN